MHLYGLKFFLALIIFIGEVLYVNNYTHSYTPKVFFNDVADFNDIIEKENDDSEVDLDKTSEAGAFFVTNRHVPSSSSFSNLAFTKSRVRTKTKIHDIKNRESDIPHKSKFSEFNDVSLLNDNFQDEPFLHQKRPNENVFEKPPVYMINDRPSQTGYFMVREKQPRSNFKQWNVEYPGNHRHSTNLKHKGKGRSLQPNNMRESKTRHCANCEDVRKLFQIPILERILLEAVGDNDASIVQNNKPLKYIIGTVAPRAAVDLLDKPENIRCLRKILRNRKKRHATYVTLRHKAKNRGHIVRRKVDPSDVPSNDQFQNIINFIVQNKTFDEGYTFVPIVFATVNPVVDVQSKESQATTATIMTCTNLPNSTLNQPSSSSNLEGSSTVLQSLNNLAAENTNSSDEMLFRVTTLGETKTENNDLSTNKEVLVAARSMAKELMDKVPQLKRSFAEILKQAENRPKKDVSTVPPNESSLLVSFSEAASTGNISSLQSSLAVLNSSTPTQGTTIPICTSNVSSTTTSTTINPLCVPTTSSVGNVTSTAQSASTAQSNTTAVSSTENSVIVSTNSSSESTSSSPVNNSGMIPGVLIYPKTKTMKKRLAEDFAIDEPDNSFLYGKIPGLFDNAEDFSKTTVNKYIDFNPLRKLRKDSSYDCKNETDDILDILSNISGDNGAGIKPVSFDNAEDKSLSDQNTDNSSLYDSSTSLTNVDAVTQTNIDMQADVANLNPSNSKEPISNIMPNLTMGQIPELEPNLNPAMMNTSLANINALNTSLLETNLPTTATVMSMATQSMQTQNTVNCNVSASSTGATSGTTTATTVTCQNPVSLSVASVPNILQSSPPPNKAARGIIDILSNSDVGKENEISTKLKRLESDLKLVNEVQNILNGMSAGNHNINKRDVGSGYANSDGKSEECDETTTLFELNVKVVSQRSPVANEINGLGKLLSWEAKQPKDNCRVRRKVKKKKKKQIYKKLDGPDRFLGLGTQNFQ